MDHVEITSAFSREKWAGVIELSDPKATEYEKLEEIFRYFNRLDDEDAARLRDINFTQPSLSAGDRVVLNGHAYQCDVTGFSPDERDPHEPINPWPLGGKY